MVAITAIAIIFKHMVKSDSPKNSTNDITKSSKSLWGFTFAQDTTEILSNMVRQLKQTKWSDVFSTPIGIRIIFFTRTTWATIILFRCNQL